MVPKKISLKINTAAVNESRMTSRVTLHQSWKIYFYRRALKPNDYLWIAYYNLCGKDIAQILEISKVELYDVLICTHHCELGFWIGRHIVKGLVGFCLHHNVSVWIPCLLCFHTSKAMFVDNSALKIENNLVWSAEIQEKAGIVTWDRI